MLKTIYHFLRLIRIINLLVIALTMTLVQLFFLRYRLYLKIDGVIVSSNVQLDQISAYLFKEGVNFSLLIISTLLIAAAGNIINDYFDVRADRVNKPHRLIITKHIKKGLFTRSEKS